MIGLALVAAVGVLGSSLKDSVRKIASDAIGADYIVSPTAVGMDQAAFKAVQDTPGVGEVTGLRGGEATIAGADEFPTSLNRAALGTTVDLSMKSGQHRRPRPGQHADLRRRGRRQAPVGRVDGAGDLGGRRRRAR